MFKTNIICIYFLSIFFIFVTCEKEAVIKFSKVECFGDANRLVNITCRIKAISRDIAIANMHFDLVKPVNNLFYHMKLFKRSNGYHPYVFEFKQDMCELFKHPKYIPILDIVIDLLKKYSNINHTCPYEGSIIAKDMKINSSAVPTFFPSGEYRIDVRGLDKTTYIGMAKLYFIIPERNFLELK